MPSPLTRFAFFLSLAAQVWAADVSADRLLTSNQFCSLNPTWQTPLASSYWQPEIQALADYPVGSVNISADTLELTQQKTSVLSGNVRINNLTQRILTDELTYEQNSEQLTFSKGLRFQDEQISLRADFATLNRQTEQALFDQVEYQLNQTSAPQNTLAASRFESVLIEPDSASINPAYINQPAVDASVNALTVQGHARTAQQNQSISVLNQASYTSCELDDPAWQLQADKVTLYHDRGYGIARHMTLRLKSLPVLYFPYLNFPINDRRKTGFLFPTMGYSDDNGFEMATPFYWNIAPAFDATLTPRLLSQRGVQLQSEWRYLNRWSTNQLDYEYLNDVQAKRDRWAYNVEHQGQFRLPGSRWTTRVDAAEVSDLDYFTDLGNRLETATLINLEKRGILQGRFDALPQWQFSLQGRDFQIIDDAILANLRPYRLLPQLTVQGQYQWDRLQLDWLNQFSVFDQDNRISGQRTVIQPSLSYTWGGLGGFVTPRIQGHFTHYDLQDEGILVNVDDQKVSRSLPVLSVDTGLFLEKDFTSPTGSALVHTIEPRLFFLYVPFKDQDNLPLFDTTPVQFNFNQLFNHNRFTGQDRIADARQVSAAVTTRLLSQTTGQEYFRFSVGQIFYDERPRVGDIPMANVFNPGLQASVTNNSNQSNIVTETQWRPPLPFEGELRVGQTTIWNPETTSTIDSRTSVRYQASNQKIVNIGWRRLNADEEQSDVAIRWPVTQRWTAFARWNYSLSEAIDLDTIAGLEYDSCCYALRVFSRRFLNNEFADTVEYDYQWYIQLSLKGFSSFGQDAGQLLEQSITGFRDDY